VILSPYLTSRGTARWVNHVRAAIERGVRVRIVTKPGEEFGGASQDEVKETVESLNKLGIAVDLRGRMHEKIAIIDDRIVWHGSLNILSHSHTSESMLRLVGETACRKLVDLISPPHSRRDKERKPSERENRACAGCSGETVLRDGRFGIYFECPKCGEKINPGREFPRKGVDGQRQGAPGTVKARVLDDSRGCTRPGCNGRMIPKTGRHGPFLGCSDYPRCRATSPR
jgi:ssDNA-binding Zn-finger/Zn-ribbon topoisomerase 1